VPTRPVSIADVQLATPSVSVCIPVYNGETYLGETIRSVLDQTYGDFELVVLDNGSTDNSGQIARSFGDRRMRIERNSSVMDLVPNWNRLISLCRSPLIKLVCADDLLHPRCLELQVGQIPAAEAFLSASFLGTTTYRLLCEPKDAQLTPPRLRAAYHAQGLLLETDRPVLDLFLWDPEDRLELLDNYVTLASGGQTVLRARGSFRRLAARSLAGRHPIEM